ncbi:hypothetical protein ALP94_03889 [Pseudomonas savastanoi pv. glycinea]|nr:hypothetical protein ALP94_03889 [Pseudomonas savastanoi pv. glycinea]
MKTLSRIEVLEHASNGVLLDILCGPSAQLIIEMDSSFVAEIASAHNDGDIDALYLFSAEAMKKYEGHSHYKVERIFKMLLSEIEVSADRLLSTLNSVINAHDSDHLFPTQELSDWCRKCPTRVFEIFDAAALIPSHESECIAVGLTSGTQNQTSALLDRAIQFLTNGSDAEKRGAALALSLLTIDEQQDWQRVLSTFDTVLDCETDEIRSAILRATFNRLKDAPPSQIDAMYSLITKGISFPGDHVLRQLAYALAFNFEDIPLPLAERLLDALTNVTSEQPHIASLLDLGLMRFIQAGWPTQARRFIERALAKRQENLSIEQFSSVRRKLLEVKGQPLEDWVIAWLLNGDAWLCTALSHEFFDLEFANHWFDIDFHRVGLTDHEYAYLGRKVIGVFFYKPKVMTSIIVSLLRSASSTSKPQLVSLLKDPILVNYSGTVRGFLQPIAESTSDPASASAKEAIQAEDDYLAGLRAPGIISELHPSEREQQVEWQRRSDEMNETMKESRKNSLFGSIISESILLYGSRSVTWVADLHQGPPRRLETPLTNIGHSMEIPREYVVDPLGLSYILYKFRTEKRPE